uniref:Uncharacterized protein n=1 Tax=Dromaius novaehollandiae TaxID=8790 RepID=A0A8C4K9C5_DRONO
VEFLRNLLSRTLGLGGEKPEKVLDELTLEGVSRFMQSEKCSFRGGRLPPGLAAPGPLWSLFAPLC